MKLNRNNKIVKRGKCNRNNLVSTMLQLDADKIVMEACAGSHYWGRQLQNHDQKVVLIPPHKVKPYVQGQKNDQNDALAIAEAAGRLQMNTVAVKTIDQQDMCALHKLREQSVKQRTQKRNSIRALLAERGFTTNRGSAALYVLIRMVMKLGSEGSSAMFVECLKAEFSSLLRLEEAVTDYDERIMALLKADEMAPSLKDIPGFGPICASYFAAVVGDGSQFECGRSVSAWLGLVPRQHSTGGKARLLGISKHGDRYLRKMLIHGARSVLSRARDKDDKLSRWMTQLEARQGRKKTIVAIANKMARVGWALQSKKVGYDPA